MTIPGVTIKQYDVLCLRFWQTNKTETGKERFPAISEARLKQK